MGEKVTALLEAIDKQLVHLNRETKTDYGRGFVQGLNWTRTEICKAFGV